MSLVSAAPYRSQTKTLEDRRIRALERTVGELRERVRQLEASLSPPWEAPPHWRLTKGETAIFSMLLRRDLVTFEQFGLILDSDIDVDIDPLVKVFICKIRKKLVPHEVEIVSVRGLGYRLRDRLSWKAKLG